jgi:hypothetical protein
MVARLKMPTQMKNTKPSMGTCSRPPKTNASMQPKKNSSTNTISLSRSTREASHE